MRKAAEMGHFGAHRDFSSIDSRTGRAFLSEVTHILSCGE